MIPLARVCRRERRHPYELKADKQRNKTDKCDRITRLHQYLPLPIENDHKAWTFIFPIRQNPNGCPLSTVLGSKHFQTVRQCTTHKRTNVVHYLRTITRITLRAPGQWRGEPDSRPPSNASSRRTQRPRSRCTCMAATHHHVRHISLQIRNGKLPLSQSV